MALAVMGASECWRGVTEPFEDINKIKSGATIELDMDPRCFGGFTVTASADRCRQDCRGEDDCADRCAYVGQEEVKTFFVLWVREPESFTEKAGKIIAKPVEYLLGGNRNTVSVLSCKLGSKPFTCSNPGDDSKKVTIKIVREMEEGQRYPICEVTVSKMVVGGKRLCRELA